MCCLDEAVQQMEEGPACQKINELKVAIFCIQYDGWMR